MALSFSRLVLITIKLLCIILTISPVYAANSICTTTKNNTMVVGNIKVAQGIPIGGQLAQVTTPAYQTYKCSNFNVVLIASYINGQGTQAASINGLKTYIVPNTGGSIGYTIAGNSSMCSSGYVSVRDGDDTTGRKICELSPSLLGTTNVTMNYQITFYKLATITYGSIASFIPAQSGLLTKASGFGTVADWEASSNLTLSGMTLIAPTCSVTTPNVSIAIPDALASDFTAVGSTPVFKDFNVGLNCESDASVTVMLDGQPNAEVADTSILALTNTGAAGVASGIGIQITYNNTPLHIKQPFFLKTASSGVQTLDFQARYYQTKPNIKPGKADSTATLTFTYQ